MKTGKLCATEPEITFYKVFLTVYVMYIFIIVNSFFNSQLTFEYCFVSNEDENISVPLFLKLRLSGPGREKQRGAVEMKYIEFIVLCMCK